MTIHVGDSRLEVTYLKRTVILIVSLRADKSKTGIISTNVLLAIFIESFYCNQSIISSSVFEMTKFALSNTSSMFSPIPFFLVLNFTHPPARLRTHGIQPHWNFIELISTTSAIDADGSSNHRCIQIIAIVVKFHGNGWIIWRHVVRVNSMIAYAGWH